jgi:hypothetical protein
MHFGNDAVHHCQTKACTFANTFGCKEGLENSWQNFGGNSSAIV